MSSLKLDELTDKYPLERDTIDRLIDLISKDSDSQQASQPAYTVSRLIEKLSPNSNFVLIEMLSFLVEKGITEKILRVVSPYTNTGLQDYSSIEEIPSEIHDITSDVEFVVSLENIELLYKFIQDE